MVEVRNLILKIRNRLGSSVVGMYHNLELLETVIKPFACVKRRRCSIRTQLPGKTSDVVKKARFGTLCRLPGTF